MHRVLQWVLLMLLFSHTAHADDARSARQRYVLHVPAKISFENTEIPQQASTAAESTPGSPLEAAFRLNGTEAAGITAQFEFRSIVPRDGKPDVVSPRPMKLRIATDDKNRWILAADGQRGRDATGSRIQASSRGAGAATLVISNDNNSRELEIIGTIMSND